MIFSVDLTVKYEVKYDIFDSF